MFTAISAPTVLLRVPTTKSAEAAATASLLLLLGHQNGLGLRRGRHRRGVCLTVYVLFCVVMFLWPVVEAW